MNSAHLAKSGAYFLLLQAVIEMTDDLIIPAEVRSRTIANYARQLMRACVSKNEMVLKYNNGAVADQMFFGSQVLTEFAVQMQLVPEDRIEELDGRLEKLFAQYTNPNTKPTQPFRQDEIVSMLNLHRQGLLTAEQITQKINDRIV